MIKPLISTLSRDIVNKSLLYYLLLAIPVCALLMHLLALCIYGVDVPYMDDWRSLIVGDAGSFSTDYLFKSANDTMSVTGQLLDSLSVRLIAGHNVLNQAISIIVILAGLFILQFYLLKSCTENKLILGLSVLSIAFMMQPGSYWGLQTIAYHQAIPLLCILGILYIIIQQPVNGRLLSGLIIFVITLIGGLSYISGAVTLSAIAVWVLFLSFLAPAPFNRLYRSSGAGILFGALITLPLQLKVILINQSGKTHRADASWALPTDSDFWLYILGKVSRAAGYYNNGSGLQGLSFATIVFVFSLLCMCYVLYAITVLKEKNEKKSWGFYCIFGSLFIAVILYLFMVSAGRANLRPESVSSVYHIFSFGQLRFHFFWFTILIPWLTLFLCKLITSIFSKNKSDLIISSISIATIFYIFYSGTVFSHLNHFKDTNRLKTKGFLCIKTKILNKDNINCPDLIPADITNALQLASKLKLSFTSSLYKDPIAPVLLHQQNSNTKDKIKVTNAELISDSSNLETINLSASQDPQILLDLSNHKIDDEFRKCSIIDIEMTIEAKQDGNAQVFFNPGITKSFNELDSTRVPYTINDSKEAQLNFKLLSLSGFSSEFRIDPGDSAGNYKISDLIVRCTMQ